MEGDFVIDGYKVGEDSPVKVATLSPGSADWRVQDSLNPVGDNRYFGRDYLTSPTWSFGFTINGGSAAEARATLGELKKRWRNPNRRVPGAESVLSYTAGGQTRRIYGRPRGFQVDPHDLFVAGRIVATAEFVTNDVFHYSDTLQTRRVTPLPGVSGSVALPAQLPMVFSGGAVRSGLIDEVGGDAPSPVEILVHGPVAGTWAVTVGGYRVEATHTMAYDRWLVIDTRKMTVLSDDGADLSGKISRRTFLPDVRLMPGPAELVFERNDDTGTSYADVSWRSTWYGF